MLAELPKNRGGRPSENQSHDATTLAEHGINKSDSSRCQRIASIPEGEFESYVHTVNSEGLDLTTAGVLRLWYALNSDSAPHDHGPSPFLPHVERDAVKAWLGERRSHWPENHRTAFCNFVRGILDELEGITREDDRGGGAGAAVTDPGATPGI
jgi:hypothetical protein